MTDPVARDRPEPKGSYPPSDEGEHCQSCGRGYSLVWTAPDAMWTAVTGRTEGGLRCPDCFDREAWATVGLLRWVPEPIDAWQNRAALPPPAAPGLPRLVEAARELRDAEDAYWAMVERGPVRPPDEPDFGPWRRWKAAQAELRAALAETPGGEK